MLGDLFSGLIKKAIYAVLIAVGGTWLITNYSGNEDPNSQLTTTETLADENASIGTKIGILIDKLISKLKDTASDIASDIDNKAKQELNAKNMPRLFSEGELQNLRQETGFPATTANAVPRQGIYDLDFGDNDVHFLIEPQTTPENQYVVGKITLIFNGDQDATGYYCYCGASCYAVYNSIEEVGQSAEGYLFAQPNGKAFIWYVDGNSYKAELRSNQ